MEKINFAILRQLKNLWKEKKCIEIVVRKTMNIAYAVYYLGISIIEQKFGVF